MQPQSRSLSFVHRFVPAQDATLTPLVLLHGQGGGEDDLVPFGQGLLPGTALLAPRGATEHEGMRRFFQRMPNGDWNVPDFRQRTADVAAFVAEAGATYGLPKPLLVGFSNGSNIAWSIALTRPELIRGAILMRPMMPFDPRPLPDLSGLPLLVIAGATDQVIPADQPAPLIEALRETRADLTCVTLDYGHRIRDRDLEIAREWLAARPALARR